MPIPLDGGQELENPRPHSTRTHRHRVLIRNVISRWVKFWARDVAGSPYWPLMRLAPTAAAPIKLGPGRYCDETRHHLPRHPPAGFCFPWAARLGSRKNERKMRIREGWFMRSSSAEAPSSSFCRGRSKKFIASNARTQSQMRDGRDSAMIGQSCFCRQGSMVC